MRCSSTPLAAIKTTIVLSLTTLGHDFVMTLMTIDEGLVTILVLTGDYLVMTYHDNTNDLCDNTDNP
jgi:hypothetical protein